jgi:hypothetical protein
LGEIASSLSLIPMRCKRSRPDQSPTDDPGPLDAARGSEILTNVMRDAVQRQKGMLADES